MTNSELEKLIKELAALPKECEQAEFKLNNSNPQVIGEYNQLPALKIIVGDNYTRIILYGHKTLRQMDKQDKVRACYLHACLKYVSGEYMTNQSLRERFGIEVHNYSIVSRIISETIQSGLIKDYDTDNKSKKYARYVPYWF